MIFSAFDSPPSLNKIFRFENTWLDYEGCHSIVTSTWNSNTSSPPLHSFAHLISCTKRNLCRWRRSSVCHFDSEIHNIELEISSMDQNSTLLDDHWRITWLRALKNCHAALLRKKLFIGVNVLRICGYRVVTQIRASSTKRSKLEITRIKSKASKIFQVTSTLLKVILKILLLIIIRICGVPLPILI